MLRKYFWAAFLNALAALASIVTLVLFVYKDGINLECYRLVVIVIIVLICCLYAYSQSRRITDLTINFRPKLSITIKKGDLFKNKGVVVIPVNEYFDTQVDDVIIAHGSIHGQFIDRYFQNKEKREEFDRYIELQLKDNDINKKSIVREYGNKRNPYELGTCVMVTEQNIAFVLVAFTHFNTNNHANIVPYEFQMVISKLFDFLEENANGREVFMPLMGTGQSGIKKLAQKILFHTLSCIDFACDVSIHKGVNIIIDDKTFRQINLNLVKEHYKDNIIN
jgi:hypothetical protein